MFDFFTALISLYSLLYRIAVLITICLFWIALSHTDKIHIRERCRRISMLIMKKYLIVFNFFFCLNCLGQEYKFDVFLEYQEQNDKRIRFFFI